MNVQGGFEQPQTSNSTSESKSNAIEVHNYTFYYEQSPTKILDSINFTINTGEVVFIGGPSGSGKSTLIRSMIGYIAHNVKGKMKGKITIQGKNVFDYSQIELSSLIGIVFQNPDEQLVTFTVFDEIAFALENLCLPKDEIIERTNRIADQLGITHLLDRSLSKLSGGEKQKVVIATALVKNPKFLFFDEPLAFLDFEAEKALLDILKTIKSSFSDITIIIAEHRMEPFRSIIDKIILLDRFGRLSNKNPEHYYAEFGEIRGLPDSNSINTQIDKNSENTNNTGSCVDLEPIIEVKDVSFKYGERTIFSNLNLTINKGEILGIIGTNGIGKSTLLYLIAKILMPYSGEILFKGRDLVDINDEDFFPKIGYIFQNPEAQIFESTVKDEILFGARNFGMVPPKKKTKKERKGKGNIEHEEEDPKTADILDKYCRLIFESRVDIKELLESNPFKLSWGQKRRLNIGSVLSYEPEVLLLDEPFIGQDSEVVNEIFEILNKLQEDNKTIVIVSHDLKIIKKKCTRIINLNEIISQNTNKAVQLDELVKEHEKNGKLTKDLNAKEEKTPGELENNTKKPKDKAKDKKKNEIISRKKKKLMNINRLMEADSNVEKESIISSVNSNSKLFFIICLTFFLFFSEQLENFYLFLLIPFTLIILARLSVVEFLKKFQIFIWLTVVYIFVNSIFDASIKPDDEIFFTIFGLPVRKIAFFYAVRTGVIIICLFSTAMVYTRTTPLKQIIYGLIQIGLPYRYVFSFMVGLRYVPLIEYESWMIEVAQKLRGLGINKSSNPKKVFNHIYHRLSILIINIMRKISNTTIALEYRNFGIYKKRTNLTRLKFTVFDAITLLLSLMLIHLTVKPLFL